MMHSNEEEIKTLISSLKTWGGEQVLISKEEKGDRDQTIMKLDDISVKHRGRTVDDYVSPAAVQLKGRGRAVMQDTDVPI